MAEAVFLSAGVPDPRRGPEFAATSDTVAINAAVSALVHVVLGRRPLVWGGHPAITPMILEVARGLDIDYGKWVTLYQTSFFEDVFPEDNERFKNVVFTEAIRNDREASLLEMRRRMFSDREFASAVFIGGMGGIVLEFELFKKFQPHASVIPVMSTGGASLIVGECVGNTDGELSKDLDYIAVFHRNLNISTHEKRYVHPEDQPTDVEDRLWRGRKSNTPDTELTLFY